MLRAQKKLNNILQSGSCNPLKKRGGGGGGPGGAKGAGHRKGGGGFLENLKKKP